MKCKDCIVIRECFDYKMVECTDKNVISFGEFNSYNWTCIEPRKQAARKIKTKDMNEFDKSKYIEQKLF